MIFLRSTVLALAASQLAAAWPMSSEFPSVKYRAEDIQAEYDYVIIGGGTSGLTIGDRLTEDGKYSVLAIEYGYYDTETGMTPKRMFNITSVPQPNLNNRPFNVGIGCVVGGSSCVNGQVFLRGTREEYDAWAELSGVENSTWNWEGLLPYFRKGITLIPPDLDQAKEFNITYDMSYWGTTSKIYGAFGKNILQPTIKVMYNAMKTVPGMTIPKDSGEGSTGLYWYPISQDGTTFTRSFARTGHWDDLNRPNYELLVGAKVNKILFDGDTATGVQFISRNDTSVPPVAVKARKEVILAAGAVHSPQVLMLSGIGPKGLLENVGIEVRVELPGVGSNFQDHSYIPKSYVDYSWGTVPQANTSITQVNHGGAAPNLATMIGLPVITPQNFDSLAHTFETQDPTLYLPSTYTTTQIEGYKQQQKVFSRLMRSTGVTFLEIMLSGPGGAVQNLHPMSRGNILLDPSNPEGEMIVDYRAASNPIDISVMVEILKFMRRFMTTGELAQYSAVENSPGMNVSTDEQLAEWARGTIIPSVYHPSGTCAKMLRKWGGVVDEELRVYGTRGLSVVDASVFPTLVGATTSMTVYAVAEKAADIIKARTQ